jgi:CspA family cold shock protein
LLQEITPEAYLRRRKMYMTGKVKFFKKEGWGMITGADGKDAFVHYSNIVSGDSFKSLKKDQEVSFDVEPNDKGLKAVNVTVLATTTQAPKAE